MGERKEKMRGENLGRCVGGCEREKGGEERNGRRSEKCSRKKNAQLKSVDFL